MCGIVLTLLDSGHASENLPLGDYTTLWESLSSICANRGPDWLGSTQFSFSADGYRNHLNVSISTSVLHLRGPDGNHRLTCQPHVGNDGSTFAWNGEVFEGMPVLNHENDGLKLFNLIQDSPGDIASLTRILSKIEGPYAFVYLHVNLQKPSQTLYFARDPLGRRSLLMHLPTPSEPVLILCSTSSKSRDIEYEEVSTSGIFSIPLKNGDLLEQCTKHPICTPRGGSIFVRLCFACGQSLGQGVKSCFDCSISIEQVEEFILKLDESVKSRVSNIPSNNMGTHPGRRPLARLGILFSGGVDCSVIAYLADRHVPREEPIDLLNVAFENPRALGGSQKNAIQEARAQRKRDKKDKKEGAPGISSEDQPTVAECCPTTGTYDVPDRITGLEEVEELRRLLPWCALMYLTRNVKREEPKVLELMYPSKTVMDLSLALALYFASRGKGILRHPESSDTGGMYSSPAKVLLSGLGSDELLGGYSRHRQAYSRSGWDALVSELQMDLDRLPTRNLGRDDRIISAHGRESRYPFLSLTLVSYLAQLPVQAKVDPRLTSQSGVLGAGMGDKTLLRLAAQRLGLDLASMRVKRAMQFGSRSARMEGGSGERKGHFLLK